MGRDDVPGHSGVHAIRRAGADEAAAIAELYLRARRAAAGVPPAAHSDAEVRAWLSELVARGLTWVTATTGAPAAMMVLDGAWLEQLYVAPERQRRGHGAALVRHAQRHRDELLLWTFEANVGARAFYAAHGFTPDGPSDSDNEERTPAIRYRWTAPAGGPARA